MKKERSVIPVRSSPAASPVKPNQKKVRRIAASTQFTLIGRDPNQLDPGGRGQCSTEHVVHLVRKDEPQLAPYAHRDLLEVLAILRRQDKGLDPRSVSRQHFFLQPAHGKHATAERNLPGHRDLAIHWSMGEGGDQRGCNRDARRWPL